MEAVHDRPVTAYFDVDHTLTQFGTLESFLRFYAATPSGAIVAERVDPLLALAAQTSDLHEIHQAYARTFRGESWARLRDAGVQWHASVSYSLYQPVTVNALRAHANQAHTVVFVSGSWAPCLEPIARDLGVGAILQSVPGLEADGDTLDGTFNVTMLAAGKAAAARAHAAKTGSHLADAFAYGDHRSDEDLLRVVGNPVVVGNDLHLRKIARDLDWSVLQSYDGG